MIIGLTGQSGSGKSVIADIIRQYGINIIDCDKIAHQNMEVGQVAYDEIVSCFGQDILNSDKSINRKKLGSIVFNNKNELDKLNSITHKHIIAKVKSSINPDNTNVIDAPLLFEAHLDTMCDIIWAVVCPEDIRVNRVMQRDNISEQEAKNRFKNQKSIEFFKNNSDIVFENSGSLDSLKERVVNEINKILN